MKLLMTIVLLVTGVMVNNLFALSTLSKCNQTNVHNGFYAEGGVGYYRNLASGANNQINIKPVPGVPYYPISYHNTSYAKGMGLYLGAGYQWWLSPEWSWSLGGRLNYHNLEQKGYYTQGVKTDYSYDINTLVLDTVLRLNWHISLRNTVYGEITGGVARITSQNYHLTDDTLSMSHINNTKNNFAYGVAAGWLYAVTKQTSLDVAIGYQDLGKSSLGIRVVPSGSMSKGDVEQKVRGVSARIGLVHWF